MAVLATRPASSRARPGGATRSGRPTPSPPSPTPRARASSSSGKLIVSKGIDLLLAAWPLVVAANPGARLLIVGFGEYEEAAERLWAAIESGDLDASREIAERGRELEGGAAGRSACWPPSSPPRPPATRQPRESRRRQRRASPGGSSTTRWARSSPPATRWSSRAPSRRRSAWSPPRPRLPRCRRCRPNHSGAAEVSRALAADLPPEAGRPRLVPARRRRRDGRSPTRLNGWLALEPERSAEARAQPARDRRAPVELGGRRAGLAASTRCSRLTPSCCIGATERGARSVAAQ